MQTALPTTPTQYREKLRNAFLVLIFSRTTWSTVFFIQSEAGPSGHPKLRKTCTQLIIPENMRSEDPNLIPSKIRPSDKKYNSYYLKQGQAPETNKNNMLSKMSSARTKKKTI